MKKYLLILIGFIALNINAQQPKKEIKASFDVFLDNKKIETDSIVVGYVYTNSIKYHVVINDTFTSFLLPNETYHMVITHPNYNKQMLKIVTSNVYKDMKINIYLSSKEPDCYIGYYKYNPILKKYMKYD